MSKRTKRKIVFADAFAGCGGLSLGLMQAGLTARFAIEHDKFAFETLKTNLIEGTAPYKFSWPRWLPKQPISITKLIDAYRNELGSMAGSVDVLVGGPPCQGFSSAGRRRHDDPRNKLFSYYLRLVDLLKPRIVVIENVRGFTADFDVEGGVKNYSQQLRQKLSSSYDVFEGILDLSQFGVPQSRVRYFLIALKPGTYDRNPFELLRERLPSFLRSLGVTVPVSSWSAISDLEIRRGGTQGSKDSKGFEEVRYLRPRTQYQKLMHQGAPEMNNLRLARHTTKVAKRFEDIIALSHAEGRLNITISEETRQRYGLKKRALRVLDPDRPSPTITSMPDDLIHYNEPRTLTVRENARLQSFPDWFEFQGKYTTGGHLRRKEVPRFTQVANAVPPVVAKAIGEMLMEVLSAPAKKSRKLKAKSITASKGGEQRPEVRAQG
ncbi:MAG: DNA cytosine methyltransferase [Methylovirgula sp.]|uniref:DNA cytosine methyltransferase n=1 Tax=Methylovirgula sp. TaxID=1978224 RepID=UPI0030765721